MSPPGRGDKITLKPLTRRNTSRRAAIYLRERTLKMMILRDDDGWARIGGSHSGELKEIDASMGECFLDVCFLLECVSVNRKVNLRRIGKNREKTVYRAYTLECR